MEELQPLLTNLVTYLEESREAAAKKEKLDRLRQSHMEFAKLDYDHYKHLMTFSLAAIAAFGVLLGGVFSEQEAWDIPVSRNAVVVATFVGFVCAAAGAQSGMIMAGRRVLRAGEIETAEKFATLQTENPIKGRQAPLFAAPARLSIYSFGVGVFGLGIFIIESLL